MEIGSVSHHTRASQKQGCITFYILGRCDAYCFTVTNSAMGQGAQLKWVLAQMSSGFQQVKWAMMDSKEQSIEEWLERLLSYQKGI